MNKKLCLFVFILSAVQLYAYTESGTASWYGNPFHGRKTASGEIFDMYALTAAHRTLPFNTIVTVTRLDNGVSVKVRITDRGPFAKNRIIDLSYAAAQKMGMIGTGTAEVKISTDTSVGVNTGIEWYIVAGAYGKKDNAEKNMNRIKRVIADTKMVYDGTYYKVVVGPFKRRNEADSVLRSHKDTLTGGYVIDGARIGR